MTQTSIRAAGGAPPVSPPLRIAHGVWIVRIVLSCGGRGSVWGRLGEYTETERGHNQEGVEYGKSTLNVDVNVGEGAVGVLEVFLDF